MSDRENSHRVHQDLPPLTIGLPVYNGESFVAQALSSLLAQTRGDFRLVISDNCSTDATVPVIEQLVAGDARVTLIRQSQNIGAVANFAAVLRGCETDYFMWASADDAWDPQWVERLLPLAQSTQALAFGRIAAMNQSGTPVAHPANGRSLNYVGGRYLRRMRYYLDPGLLGRANPIYGIMARRLISPAAMSELQTPQHGADVMFLYMILASAAINCDCSVTLHKRSHRGSEAMKEGSGARKRPFRRTQLLQFWRLSNRIERIALVVLYPVAVLRIYAAKAHYLLLRARRR